MEEICKQCLRTSCDGCGINQPPASQSELIKALGGTTKEEVEQMFAMLRDLLHAANKLSEAPYYIVQPFMGIVKRNAKLITKYDLL